MPGERKERGGWVWLILPVAVMMVGSNLWFLAFYFIEGAAAPAAHRTLALGPLAWSLNQLVLLAIAVRRLRSQGVDAINTLGSRHPNKRALSANIR